MKSEKKWFYASVLLLVAGMVCLLDNYNVRADRDYLESELIRAEGLADEATTTAVQAVDVAEKYSKMFTALRKQVLRDRLLVYMASIRRPTPNDFEIAQAIVDSAERYGLSVVDAAALVKVESHFMPGAVSETGAIGLTQLLPTTAQELGLQRDHIFEIGANVDTGLFYYAKHVRRYGRAEPALVRYNGASDPEYVSKWFRAREAITRSLYPK